MSAMAMIWLIIAIVGFSLSGIALVAAVFMFIKMNIPAVIGDLSGKTVAKEIKAMRESNAASGHKLHRSSPVNADRGKLTEKNAAVNIDGAIKGAAHSSKRLDKTDSGKSVRLKNGEPAENTTPLTKTDTTESLSANVNEVDIEARRANAALAQNKGTAVLGEERKTDVLAEPQGTAVLSESRETEILSEAQVTEVLSNTFETEVLDANGAAAGSMGTTLLDNTAELTPPQFKNVSFKITKSVVKIHTDEVIQ